MTDLNFFSSYLGVKRASKIKYTYVLLALTVITMSISGFYLYTGYRIGKMNSEISVMDGFLKSGDTLKQLSEANITRKKLDVLARYYAAIEAVGKSISTADTAYGRLLKNVASTLPSGVFFNTMSVTGGTIQIQGSARSRTLIAEFQHNLSTLDSISSTYVSLITPENEDGSSYKFTIKCTIKDVNTNEAN